MYQGIQPPREPRILNKIWIEIKVFTNFFGVLLQKTNVHGIRFVFNKKFHPFERLMWLFLFIATCYGAYSISSTQYQRYEANPTVISLERDYRDWNGTLPAISVCYHRRVDEGRAEYFIKKKWSIERTHKMYSYFLDYVKAVVYLNESFTRFNAFANDKRLEFVDMLEISKEVHPIINSVISSFDSNAEFVMNEIITEKGICYSVNSILSPLISTV
jgi:Amiloride-sensitive sodium channel